MDENSLTSKRHLPRVSLACDPCKARKTRCDGRQPICQPCERRGLQRSCTWNAPRRRRLKHSSNGLRGSLAPSQTRRSDYLANPSSAPTPQENFDLSLTEHAPGPLDNFDTPNTLGRSDFNRRPTAASPPPNLSTNTDSLVANSDGLATLAARDDPSLYGPSSTVAFVRDVFPVPSRPPSPNRPHSNGDNVLMPLEKAERLVELSKSAAVLPLRRDADDFVHCYWEFIHPLFPVLHRPSFLKQYEQLWLSGSGHSGPRAGRGMEELIFGATLDLVFALGCQFSDHVQPSQRSAKANDFYQRSRLFLLFEILDSTYLSLVQAMLLTAVYLQSTQHANRCWNSIGIAIRIAQSLGLHVEHPYQTSAPQLEREMRRRVWHTCLSLDRLLSMTFGRPTMLGHSWRVPLPALIDDEYLSNTSEGTQPTGTLPMMGLFVSSCEISALLDEVLRTFYDVHDNVGAGDDVWRARNASRIIEPTMQFNRRIDRFMESLPEHLKVTETPDPSNDLSDSLRLQQQVLYCRTTYTRLLSLRPILMEVTKTSKRRSTAADSLSLDDAVLRQCCTLCVETAICLIETIHRHLDSLYRSTGWHSVYFTFSSTTVLLAACKCPEVSLGIGSQQLEVAWSRSIQILQHYEEQISSAAQAIRLLSAMKRQVTHLDKQCDHREREHPSQPDQQPHGMLNRPAGHELPLGQWELGTDDPFAPDNMSDAWFAQQLLNLDWLDSPDVL